MAGQHAHGGGHRRPPAGQNGRPGPSRRPARPVRRRDRRADAGDAAHRAGAGRRRQRGAARRPAERHPGEEPAGDDLLAAGRRPFPALARRVSAAARTRSSSSSRSGRCTRRFGKRRSSPARKAAASISRSAKARWCWRARRPRSANRASSCRSPTTAQPISITLDPRFVSDFLKVLEPEKSFTLDLQDGDSAAVCTTDDGYGYVIMPLARDR